MRVHSRAAAKWWVVKRKEGAWLEPRTWVPMTQEDLQSLANDVLREYGLLGEVEEMLE